MAERLSREDFFTQGRRVCIIETDDNKKHVMGKVFVAKARACSYRQKSSVVFSEKDFKGLQFAECLHPGKACPLSFFCPVMIDRINQEPN